MLIMNYQEVCMPGNAFEEYLSGSKNYGGEAPVTIILVSSGRCSLPEEKNPLRVEAGNFVVLANKEALFASVNGAGIAGVPLFGVVAHELSMQVEEPLVLDAASCPDAPALLYRLLSMGEDLSEGQRSATAYQLVCQLAEAQPAGKEYPPLVAEAVSAIHNHFAGVYGIQELADELGVSKSHLVRAFGAAVGMSPGQYLTAVRVDAAKRALMHPAYSLDIVASISGFSGANYLCKVFKKETGATPTEWRQRYAPAEVTKSKVSVLEEMLYL